MSQLKIPNTEPRSYLDLPRPSEPQWQRMFKLIFRPIDYLEDYYQQFGDFWAVGNPERPLVYVNHPQAVQQIFAAKADTFKSGQGNSVLKYLLGENSLTLLDGSPHQRQRKLLMPPFHGEKLQQYRLLIEEITQETVQSLQAGKVFKVRPLMQEITLKVILQVVFGLRSGKRYYRIIILLTNLLEGTSSTFGSSLLFFQFLRQDWGKWSPWGRFLWLKEQVDQLLVEEIEERRQQGRLEGDDILTLLMLAKDENGEEMTTAELRDELMTLLVAGHETTASGLTWAMYWIHLLDKVEEKVRLELLQSSSYSYMEAVCKETLRIYPVAPTAFIRTLKTPMEIMGYQLPEGSVVLPCIYLIHHREDIYPQANAFKPERFLENSFSSYEYLPFGGGNRRCIGSGLAMLEMQTVLVTILQQFQFQLISSRPMHPVRRGVTLAPPSFFKMKVK